MRRYLRIATTVVGGTLCLLLVALWVRSYLWGEALNWCYSATEYIHVSSDAGVLFLGKGAISFQLSTYYRGEAGLYADEHELIRMPELLVDPSSFQVGIPYWLLLLPTATFAALPWIQWSKRFSLRTLLIAMTLLSALLGTIAVMR